MDFDTENWGLPNISELLFMLGLFETCTLPAFELGLCVTEIALCPIFVVFTIWSASVDPDGVPGDM